MRETDPTDYSEVKYWFDSLCDLSPQTQARALAQAQLSPSVREAVAELLARDQQAVASTTELADISELTQRTVVQPAATDPPVPRELEDNARVGPWVVTGLIGRGGMGAVYRAQRADGQFAQAVAIKVLSGVSGARAQLLVARERQALASVSHPNIARILDTGNTQTGAPYIAMDLVEGIPIHRFCRRRELDWRETLSLFQQLCRALAEAHRRLVLHCDLKPANILVTPTGLPMILDFGIAQALSAATLETGQREHALTPRYASPEQVRGESLTTASDVFSLGKVLALCLEHANARGLVRTEIDAVVARCNQERPELRYANMTELDAELERLLTAQPVTALPASSWYRVRKLVARRTAAVAAVALAVLGVGAFTVESTVQRSRALAAEGAARSSEAAARAAEGQTRAELVRANQAEREARTERDRAREATVVATEASTRAASSARRALAEQARATQAQQRADAERDRAVRASLAAQLAAETAKAAQNQSEAVRDFVTGIFQNVNRQTAGPRTVSAYQLLETSRVELQKQRVTDPRTRSELLQAMANIYARMGDVDNTTKLFEEVVQLERDPKSGRPLVLATALARASLGYTNAFNPRAGEPLARESLDIRRAQLGHTHLDVADAHSALGAALSDLGQSDEARTHLEATLRIRQQLLPPKSDRIGSSMSNLASFHANTGNFDRALHYYNQAIAAQTEAVGPDHFSTLNALEGKGIALRGLGRFDESEAVLRQAYEAQVRLNGPQAERTASVAIRLAEVYLEMGRWADAEQYAQTSTRILGKPALNERSLRYAAAANLLATVQDARGNRTAALASARDALGVFERALKLDDPRLVAVWVQTARKLGEAGLAPEGLRLAQRALDSALAQFKSDDPRMALAVEGMAELWVMNEQPVQARAALATLAEPSADQKLRRVAYLRVQSLVLQSEGKPALALAAAQERADLTAQHYSLGHPLASAAAVDLAKAHARVGDAATARALAQRLAERMPPRADAFDPQGHIAQSWRQALDAR
jgi:eukaryotic-like serine/threonine-protein kinase